MGWDPLDGVPVDDIDGVPLGVSSDDIDGVPCELIIENYIISVKKKKKECNLFSLKLTF